MGAATGMVNPITFAGTNKQKIGQVIALIPNPDTSVGATRGTASGFPGSMLDEMSPTAAAQLGMILTALQASVADA